MEPEYTLDANSKVCLPASQAGCYKGKQLKPGYMLLRATEAVPITDAMKAKGMTRHSLKLTKINKNSRPPVHVEHLRTHEACGCVKDAYFDKQDGFLYLVVKVNLRSKDPRLQRFFNKLKNNEEVNVSVAFVHPDLSKIKSSDEYYSTLLEVSFTENPVEKKAKVLRFITQHSNSRQISFSLPCKVQNLNMSQQQAKPATSATPQQAAQTSSSQSAPAQAASNQTNKTAAASDEQAPVDPKRQKKAADGTDAQKTPDASKPSDSATDDDGSSPEAKDEAGALMTPEQALAMAQAAPTDPSTIQKFLNDYALLHAKQAELVSDLQRKTEELNIATQRARMQQGPVLQKAREQMETDKDSFDDEAISATNADLTELQSAPSGHNIINLIASYQRRLDALADENNSLKAQQSSVAFNAPRSAQPSQREHKPAATHTFQLPKSGFGSQKRKADAIPSPQMNNPSPYVTSHSESGSTQPLFTIPQPAFRLPGPNPSTFNQTLLANLLSVHRRESGMETDH
jgi:hypothetical protein